MFVLDDNPEFTWPVTVRLPHEGGHREGRFEARFRLLPDSERERLTAEGGDLAVLRAALLALEGVELPDGVPFPNTRAALDQALDLLPIRAGLAAAYVDALFGVPSGAARGN
jgi:hypothetical protein